MADFLSAFPAASSGAAPAAASAPALPDFLTAFPAGTGAAPSKAPASTAPSAAPAAPVTTWQKFTQGVLDPINGGAQLLAHMLPTGVVDAVNSATTAVNNAPVIGSITKALGMTPATAPQIDQSIAQNEQSYQAARAAAGQSGFDGWREAGRAVASLPLGSVGPASAGLGLGGRIALGAAQGAASSATMPITDPTEQTNYGTNKLANAAVGGLGGAVINPLVSAVGGVISPNVSAAARQLLDRNVPLTPGQILGGAAARTEEKLTSVPVLGDMIKNSQVRAVQGFNRATYNEALAPIGATVAPDIQVGSDAIAAVRNQIGHVYDSIEPRASFVADQNFANDVAGIRADLAQRAPAMLQQFDNIVNNQVTAKLNPQGALNGAQWGATRSEINGMARDQVLGNATPDNRSLSGALGDLNDAINAGVGRSSPPDILPTLQSANAAWARFKQIEAAAGSTGASNNGNVFTPAQFQAAIRRGSTAAQKSTNSGLNGNLGAAAQEILGSKYPDSGTPGRAALMGLLSGGAGIGGLMTLPKSTMATGAALGLGSLPYTQIGNSLSRAVLANRPGFAAPLGRAVTNSGPYVGNALIQLLQGAQ